MRNKNAQVSVEYVIIVGFILFITIPLILIFYEHTSSTNDQVITSQVDMIAKKVVDSAESVYYLGEPSKTRIKVYMPTNIENVTIDNYEVVFKVKTKSGVTDISQPSSVNISGFISVTKGIHYISIESKGDYVWVST
ncbi:hypothetical protein COV14_03375 [Candidatus Woesearchaeota archaeon CG10_big_fil_rev_8_21_14_0_10_33_12]|nr:MAG: hypothetical protein COV14_03375 [Candidatus Woesearchaeota archaeon CG10_big_fil_rev_8_21_14_0_10_33_12]